MQENIRCMRTTDHPTDPAYPRTNVSLYNLCGRENDKTKSENVRCMKITDLPTHLAYACSIVSLYNLCGRENDAGALAH